MGAHHVELKLVEVFARHANIGQKAHTGIHTIDRVITLGKMFDGLSRSKHLLDGRRQQRNRRAPLGNVANLFDGQMFAIELDVH